MAVPAPTFVCHVHTWPCLWVWAWPMPSWTSCLMPHAHVRSMACAVREHTLHLCLQHPTLTRVLCVRLMPRMHGQGSYTDQDGVVWSGQFYNGKFFNGKAYLALRP